MGNEVCYFKHRVVKKKNLDTFVLSFQVEFQGRCRMCCSELPFCLLVLCNMFPPLLFAASKDVVFFAYCFPFTYCDLQSCVHPPCLQPTFPG